MSNLEAMEPEGSTESGIPPISPFLPGTHVQYAWDSTSLGWLKTCPRLYQYSMIDGWRSRGESVHLKFGLLYHAALEEYDKVRADINCSHDDALSIVVRSTLEETWDRETALPWESDHPNKTRETLIRSIIWYLDQFGAEDPAQTVILANGKAAVELSFKMELDSWPEQSLSIDDPKGLRQPYLLCGHLDRVVEYGGGTYVMDRKTSTATLSSSYFDQYAPDNQMSLYTMAAQVIYQTPVKGVIIDAVQIAVGFSRYSRGFAYRTPNQIEEWLVDTYRWFELAESYALEGHWPMNDKACHHYGGCVFRKVCSKSPEVRDKFLESDFVKSPWNPLVPR